MSEGKVVLNKQDVERICPLEDNTTRSNDVIIWFHPEIARIEINRMKGSRKTIDVDRFSRLHVDPIKCDKTCLILETPTGVCDDRVVQRHECDCVHHRPRSEGVNSSLLKIEERVDLLQRERVSF